MEDYITRMTKTGVITVPADYRAALGLKGGDYLRVVLDNNKLIVTPVDVVFTERT